MHTHADKVNTNPNYFIPAAPFGTLAGYPARSGVSPLCTIQGNGSRAIFFLPYLEIMSLLTSNSLRHDRTLWLIIVEHVGLIIDHSRKYSSSKNFNYLNYVYPRAYFNSWYLVVPVDSQISRILEPSAHWKSIFGDWLCVSVFACPRLVNCASLCPGWNLVWINAKLNYDKDDTLKSKTTRCATREARTIQISEILLIH